MAQLKSYLFFDGDCKEAMEYYQTIFGGKLDVMLVKDSPNVEQMPKDIQDQVLHAALKADTIEFYASDLMGYGPAKHGNTVSLCIVGEQKGEVEEIFNKLAKEGTVNTPIREEFFGTYGDLTDKFGFRWMFQYSLEQ